MVDALLGISQVVTTQVLSRAVTFLVNVFIARLAGPAGYGIGYVSLQLFSNLALFVCKEGFRKVALRTSDNEGGTADAEAQQTSGLNLGFGGLVATMASSVLLSLYWIAKPPEAASSTYPVAVLVTALASIVEALAEPAVIATFLALDFRGRAMGEGAAMLVRTFGMLVLCALMSDVALSFAVAQLLYALTWTCWFVAPDQLRLYRPAKLADGRWLLPHHYGLLSEFGSIVGLKVLLTEGEKFLLLWLFTEKDWGVFGLVSNLGSIVLRLFFAPCEEIAFSCFSSKKVVEGHRSLAEWELLRALLMLQGGLGWIGLCFGPGYSELVVRILYGKDWVLAGAPRVLSSYCVLLFALAANGIMEAYMYARCSPEWMRICKYAQLGVSLALVMAAWIGRSFGPIGLVWANTISMVLRVGICVAFAKQNLQLTLGDLNLAPIVPPLSRGHSEGPRVSYRPIS